MKRTLFVWLVVPLAMIAALELFALSVMGREPVLTLVAGDSDRDVYVNTDTLVSPAPGTVSVWNKIVPSRGSALFQRIADLMRGAGKNPRRAEYIQTLQEIDCTKDRAKVLNVLVYDEKDRIVLSRPKSSAANDIAALADTDGEVRRTVCAISQKQSAVRGEDLPTGPAAVLFISSVGGS